MYIRSPPVLPFHWGLLGAPLAWDSWVAVGVFVVVGGGTVVAAHRITDM